MKNKSGMIIAVSLTWLSMVACTNVNLEELADNNNVSSSTDSTGNSVTTTTGTTTTTSTIVSLSGDLVPVFTKYTCYNCHSKVQRQGGIDIETYSSLKSISGSTNGQLYGAISHASNFSAMPQGGGKMTNAELALFKSWITNGALNN